MTLLLDRRVLLVISALALASTARGGLTITTNTTQTGGTLTVSPAGQLIVNGGSNPLLTLTSSATTSGVQGVVIGDNTKGQLMVNSGSVLTTNDYDVLVGLRLSVEPQEAGNRIE